MNQYQLAGTIDNVKVRIRAHAPHGVNEGEFRTIDEAIQFLNENRNKE